MMVAADDGCASYSSRIERTEVKAYSAEIPPSVSPRNVAALRERSDF